MFAESLKGRLASDSNPDATTYRSFYLGMQPNGQEITGHAAELIALLCSQPSTVVGLAQKQLLLILGELTDHQVHTLVDASQAVLMRTEKKILKSQLRILAELAKAHPHLCEQITRIVGQAASTLPVELRYQARHITGKLLSHAADNTDTGASTAQPGSIPDAVPQHREPDGFFTSRPPIDSAAQAQEILFELLENTGDGADIPRLLAYIAEHRNIGLDKAQQEYLKNISKIVMEIPTITSPILREQFLNYVPKRGIMLPRKNSRDTNTTVVSVV